MVEPVFTPMGMGYLASALLDRMIAGEPPPGKPLLVAPSGVVITRESTMTVGLKDRELHDAARHIREHAREPITIDAVARQLNFSRSWLERHFRRVLGHSPQQELREARINIARRLLLDTDWTAARIANASGFTSAAYFTSAFQKATGTTPLRFRKKYHIH